MSGPSHARRQLTALTALTDAQRRVVLANETHVLVGAGAGSGKTSTVVQKLCYLLGGSVVDVHGETYKHPAPITLSDIAAITFTNESAADLKRKLRAALVATGLRPLAMDVDAARIGTIHGFCGDLLREFALRAGLPPMLTVLAEGDAAALTAACAQLAVQRAAQDGVDDDLAALLEQRKLRDVVRHVATIAEDSDRLAAWASHAGSHAESLRPHERALMALAIHARAIRLTELERQGALDFDRMIVSTRDLLREHPSVRHAVQRQLRLLIVDEFQDVDPAQRDLAYLLGGFEFADPSPTRIMLVGDPKQSIYRFRRADVSLWNSVAETFGDPRVGQHLELTENFRSREGILALVDAVVAPRLNEIINPARGRQPFEVDYLPLVAAGEERHGDRCVELIVIAADERGGKTNADGLRTIEARAIAERIAELHAAGEAYGSMAMLLGAFTSVDLYSGALKAAGIPVYVLRGEGFWETREVLDCLLALRAIRDPLDDVALVGFLRGPFVGVSDTTLLALADAKHVEGLRGASLVEPRERALLDSAMALLHRYGALRDRIPLEELIRRLIEETGFLVTLVHEAERGEQAVANLRKLLRLASANPEISLGEFLRDVSDARERADRQAEERLYRDRSDVVTITTIHSAKGLEWPIVFWSDLARGASDKSGALLCGRSAFRLRLEVGDTDDKGNVIDDEYAALKGALQEEQSAEWSRLWYVASTRAKRLLVLSGISLGPMRKGPPSVAAVLLERFPTLLDSPTPDTIEYVGHGGRPFQLVVHVARDAANETAANAAEPAARVTEPVAAVSSARYLPPAVILAPTGRTRLSATQLMTFKHDAARWRARYVLGFEPDGGYAARRGSGSTATLGTIVHDVLEHYNYELADIAELVEDAISRQDPDGPEASSDEGQRYRERIHTLVVNAATSDAWQRVSALANVRNELTFVRICDGGGVIEGAIDLIGVDGDWARILDVKTGSTHAADLLERRYVVQGAVYASAVQAITGRPSGFSLLQTDSGAELAVDVTSIDVDALVASLRDSGVRDAALT